MAIRSSCWSCLYSQGKNHACMPYSRADQQENPVWTMLRCMHAQLGTVDVKTLNPHFPTSPKLKSLPKQQSDPHEIIKQMRTEHRSEIWRHHSNLWVGMSQGRNVEQLDLKYFQTSRPYTDYVIKVQPAAEPESQSNLSGLHQHWSY